MAVPPTAASPVLATVPTCTAVSTHCPYCALQCSMTLTPAGGTAVVEAGEGGLCRKGWTSAALLDSPRRLTSPLVRDGRHGALREASWDEALDRAAAGFRAAQATGGPDGVGVFGGGGLTNEKAYLLGKLARVALRTSQIDYNGRFCMSSAAAGAMKAFGLDRGLPFPLADIAGAGAVLLVGSNLAETMPPVVQHLTRQKENGGALVVVDPRRTPTAAAATLHLQVQPGTDLALANGLLFLAIEQGLVDEQFVAARTTGWDDVRRAVASSWPAEVERATGVSEPDLREAVRLLASADRAMVLTARGAEQHAHGVDTVSAFVNLALALGLPGRPGSGWGCLTGQGNGQGGREHGQKADQLPGYRKLDDPAARAHVAAVWGVDPDSLPQPGRSAYELLDALGDGGGPTALLLMGSNPVVSAPRAGHVQKRLASLDCLVVADVVLSETAAMADVVLPVAQWAEEDGTTTDLQGRVLLRRRALSPPAGVRTDLDVLAGIAERMGCATGFPVEPEAAFDELRRASAGGAADYAGISYDRLLAGEALHWPCPAPGPDGAPHPGTPRLFLERFAHPDGRARFVAVRQPQQAEPVDEAFPLLLTTGRVAAQYQSGAQTRRIGALTETSPSAFVELHPFLATRLEVADGERVRVSTRRGEAFLRARVVDTIRPDTVFVPFHWAGRQRANLLTSDALDPTSRMPAFKVCAARIDRVAEAVR
ncbi:MAG: nitrite reductase [Frankiales bacterium]|nr:nitrite reductase [Frankiales bacterium]